MAFFTAAFRRAASTASTATLASICSITVRHQIHGFAALSSTPGRRRSALPLTHFYSSPAAKPPSNADLLNIIDSEIKCAEESDDHERVEEIPVNFPFNIQDNQGESTITLRRTIQGEDIEVTVSMPSLVTGVKTERNRGEEVNGEDDEERQPDSQLPLIVNVSKADGTGLEFTCTAFPDDILIQSMSVSPDKHHNEGATLYEGPEFEELDENVQKAFHKYLMMRGITPTNMNFLHEYMINKDSREYLLWLKNLKQFMQK